MLVMKVCGLVQCGVSTTKAMTVGKVEAKASEMIEPLALHVNISICPGVSTTMNSGDGFRGFSHSAITCAHRRVSVVEGGRAAGAWRSVKEW